jgi:hypothetical protein
VGDRGGENYAKSLAERLAKFPHCLPVIGEIHIIQRL